MIRTEIKEIENRYRALGAESDDYWRGFDDGFNKAGSINRQVLIACVTAVTVLFLMWALGGFGL